ncbi:DUF3552 domain-containing protein [Candidatus Gracilibacteria bacterium]|nr:DUF3552 domain-containing protein [Candidatus Gracilibacteria bacterium]
MIYTYLIIGISTLVISGLLSAKFLSGTKLFDFDKKKKTASDLIEEAQKEAVQIKGHTQRTVQNRKESLDQEFNRRKQRLEKQTESLKLREENIDRKSNRNNQLKLNTASIKEDIQSKQEYCKRVDIDVVEKLSSKTGLSMQDEKDKLLNRYSSELELEHAEKLAKMEEEVKEGAVKKAKAIIVNIIQRLCSPTSVETRAVTVKVHNDRVKGKIIGKGGQNIQLFEKLLTVDVVFNDLPGRIHVSAFNLVNRRIAQKALRLLVRVRGTIDEKVIRDTIKKASKETDEELYEIGKKALKKIGIQHEDKEFIRIVGRLQYRTSYGQNIMKHSMEVAWVSIMIGGELGLNLRTCRIAGFLHDLGKAIDQDPNITESHDVLSKQLMEKFGFNWEEVHAAWTHHDLAPQETPEALIIKAADAVSAGRPGARAESLQRYLDRIHALEDTALSFEGVKRTYAISAGREVRLMVDPEIITDEKMGVLAGSVAKKIETELAYPGKIKVNVIRRTTHIEQAR